MLAGSHNDSGTTESTCGETLWFPLERAWPLTPEQTGRQRRAGQTLCADETGPCGASLPGTPQSCVPTTLAGHVISTTQSRERRAEGAGEGRDGRGPQDQARPHTPNRRWMVTPRPHVTPGIKDQTQNLLRDERAWLGGTEGEALGEQAEGLHTSCGPHRVCTALRLRLLRPSGFTPMSDPGTRLRQLQAGSSESSLAAPHPSRRNQEDAKTDGSDGKGRRGRPPASEDRASLNRVRESQQIVKGPSEGAGGRLPALSAPSGEVL